MNKMSFISEKLHSGHTISCSGTGELVENNLVTPCIGSIINFKASGCDELLQGLLILEIMQQPVCSPDDLNVMYALPINSQFRCKIEESPIDLPHIKLKITSQEKTFILQMPFGSRTESFVSEILRASDVAEQTIYEAVDFHCLQEYISRKNEKNSILVNENHFDNSIQKDSLGQIREMNHMLSFQTGSVRTNILSARESQIDHQMSQKEDTYTDLKEVKAFIGTWNVNGQPPSVGLSEWLSADEEPPDIYAVGFQELDLSKEVFLFNATPREPEWLKCVLNGVHPKAKYRKVRNVRLVGMMLVVLVQEKHYAYVRNVSMDSVGTGLMNKLGNKGAVSIRMDFYNTSICFVNAHMAAHVEEFERRNEDHDDILKRTVFHINNINGQPRTIKDHHHIYFFGDMNYRLNPVTYNVKEVASTDFQILVKHDQLLDQKEKGRIFMEFQEGPIHFKPTFKYDLYTDDWDSSEKARLPAWCDRILWKGEGIDLLEYRSHPTLNISDHKPVSAAFTAKIKEINASRYRKVYEEVMKDLDKMENDALPQVSVKIPANPTSKENEIILDPVRFLQPQNKEIIVENTGQVTATFKFIEKLNDSACKPWLTISPIMKTLSPNQQCTVSFEVLVDKNTAPQLNTGSDKLYDILVLHLEGGKDIFITIIGDYCRSCFGCSINALVHMRAPFVDIPISRLLDLESKNPTQLCEMPLAIPKELWYLIDHIHQHGMQIEGLFTSHALKKEISDIIVSLDAGVPERFLPGSVLSAAEVLLLFLDALSESVIPGYLYGKALEATQNFALCIEVIDLLPDYHRNVFKYLMAFLKELLRYSDANNLDAKTLAHAFGSVLIRPPITPKHTARLPITLADDRKKDTFIHHFLVNEYD